MVLPEVDKDTSPLEADGARGGAGLGDSYHNDINNKEGREEEKEM